MNFQFGQNIRSGIVWIGSLKTIGQIFVWVNTIIIAHFLDPADYGLAGMANLITSFLLLIGNFGFGASIIQRKDLKDIHLNSLFWITFAIGIVFMSIVYISAPLAATFFKNPKVDPLLQLSAVAMFFHIISDLPNSLLLKKLKYKHSGLIDLISNITASVSVLVFAIMGFGAYSLILGSIITGFLKFALACLWNFWIPKLRFRAEGLRGFIKFGSAVIIDRILWYLYSNSDYMILAKKLGAVPFGYYSFAFNFASMPTTKIQPIIFPVLYSSFSIIQDDRDQIRIQYLRIINYTFKIYVMIFCGMFWVSSEFVSLFLGSKWEPIILVLQILLIIQPLRGISSIGPALINALGKPEVTARNMFIFVGIMVPSFLLGSRWGMIGVAAMWCIAYPVAYFITLTISLRVAQIPLKNYLSQLLPGFRLALAVSIVLYTYSRLIPYLFSTTGTNILWISFAGKIVLGTVTYCAVLWIFDRNFFEYVLRFIKPKSDDDR